MGKPTIVMEFDGVINDMLHGWKGVDKIEGEPVKGAEEALDDLKDDYRIVIYSFRCKDTRGKEAIVDWLEENNLSFDEVVLTIPPHLVYISQKAVRFERKWEDDLVDRLKMMNPKIE